MAVETEHRYSNEAERANYDIYDDFKLKKNPLFFRFIKKNILVPYGLKIILDLKLILTWQNHESSWRSIE